MTKISELTDEDILDFLMTSEYEDEFKPEEYKFFLTKWRYFYRVLHGRNKITNDDLELLTTKFEKELDSKDLEISNLNRSKADLENKINSLKSRKLTFKERWTGKIGK